MEMKQSGEGMEVLLFRPNQDDQDKGKTVTRIIEFNNCLISGF